MRLLDLLELRSQVSPDAEDRIRQSLRDLRLQAEAKRSAVQEAERSLDGVWACDDDVLLRVVCAQDLVQKLSKLRSEWCRAQTAVERCKLELDRLLALRSKYEMEAANAV